MSCTDIKQDVINGHLITKDEALGLCYAPTEALCSAADEIRQHFCAQNFDICTIVNAKSGRCSEDCKYCAQSSFYCTNTDQYSLMDTDTMSEQAKYNHERGILRYSIVTSGKKLDDAEVDIMCGAIRTIRDNVGISVCASFGLLDKGQFAKLKSAGLSRVHNNLETSRRYFSCVCTTHSYSDKIAAIRAAQEAGLEVCSGGIMGLGETMEDRIDMALDLRALGIRSVPLNMLSPIPGTPFEHAPIMTMDEMCRIIAVFRFLLPDASIRLAGGRGAMPHRGRQCFLSGANAVISGDMLTTSGISIDEDMRMIEELGFHVRLC